jgi:hypothetical protein
MDLTDFVRYAHMHAPSPTYSQSGHDVINSDITAKEDTKRVEERYAEPA